MAAPTAYTSSSTRYANAAASKGQNNASRQRCITSSRCHDNPTLQVARSNLESLCAPCHAPLQADDRRGFSYAMDSEGYATDPKHPSNRPRLHLSSEQTQQQSSKPGGRVKRFKGSPSRPVGARKIASSRDFSPNINASSEVFPGMNGAALGGHWPGTPLKFHKERRFLVPHRSMRGPLECFYPPPVVPERGTAPCFFTRPRFEPPALHCPGFGRFRLPCSSASTSTVRGWRP